ncbi:transposase [Streptomyces sp. NPDC094034]|uniref:small ribosomal subunit Rsm22 family protein n=1 Tax=Streptomyces sp. NPDC094034 TaxID=3155309 RepID=UPI00331ED120
MHAPRAAHCGHAACDRSTQARSLSSSVSGGGLSVHRRCRSQEPRPWRSEPPGHPSSAIPLTACRYLRITEARDRLIAAGYRIAAPCPHDGACPIERGTDWCHFAARVSRSSLHQRRALGAQVNALLEAHPLSPVLTSMPGVGVRTATVLLVTVGDGTSLPSAAHLASYAGLAPATKSSGTSIHGEHAPRGCNRRLKRAIFLSAFACMNADPASRTYYDKQRARGKNHTQALLRLARQRISALFAMLRDGTFYESRPPTDAEPAA